MSHFLDRLRYFTAPRPQFSDGHGAVTDEDRQWEDAYRQRWQHDKIVRSMGVVTGIVWVSLILTYLSEVRRTPVVGSVA
ncbi:nitrate reductase alpha subunit [Paraburkholderia sp. MM5496-R1]